MKKRIRTINHQQSTINPPRRRGPARSDRRTTWERLSAIDDLIRAGRYPNARTIAARLGICTRTVKRDIAFLKNDRRLPIAYDQLKYGFYYTKPVDGFAKAPMTQADIEALMVARKAIAEFHGIPFENRLRSALQKLAGQLDQRELQSIAALGNAVSFRPLAPEDSDPHVFRAVRRAIKSRKVLVFKYRKKGDPDSSVLIRQVQPYHLRWHDSRWYLLGYDLARGAIRTFAMNRVSETIVTGRRFPKFKPFNPDEYLRNSLGVRSGHDDYEVVIEFDAIGADLIRGRRWHASQELITLPGGGARLRLLLNGLEEIQHTILSWGVHATVIRPVALRERLAAVTGELSERYRADDYTG